MKLFEFFEKDTDNILDYSVPLLMKFNEVNKAKLAGRKITFYGRPHYHHCSYVAGRVGENVSLNEIQSICESVKKNNFDFQINFTHPFIKDLNDKWGNKILEICNEYNAWVCVSNDDLFTFIKKNFSNIKLKCSLLKSEFENKHNDINWYYQMSDIYDRIVINHYINTDLLSQFQKNKHRFEILVDSPCTLNCKNTRLHLLNVTSNERAGGSRDNISGKCMDKTANWINKFGVDGILNLGFKNIKFGHIDKIV